MDRRSVLGLGTLALAGTALRASAANTPSSDHLAGDPAEIIPLWPHTPPGGPNVHLVLNIVERSPAPDIFRDRATTGIQQPILTVFRPAKPDGSALLLAPGGSYARVVIDKEGFETARRLNAAGITAFVLRYRLPAEGWADAPDVPLQDAQRAMRLIRARAADFAIDPARVGVLGFSAGGHVAASLITRFDAQVYAPIDAADQQDARPDFAGLMYPVVSMIPPVAHAASRENLLGAHPADAQQAAYSCERLVTAKTPPTFLALAADDKDVDPRNSLSMLDALRAAGVRREFHMFEEGGHGFGLRLAQGKPAAIWPDLFLRWGARHGAFRNVTL
jgi:acetyl esterase/lipase